MKINWCKPGILVLVTASLLTAHPAVGQHTFNNSVSQYYRDGYLWNPALAGENGTRLYGLYNSAWSGFDDASKQVGLAADRKLSETMGLGINLASSTAGAFQRYNGALSYAYRIRLKNNAGIRIGGDLSFYKEHLDSKYLVSNGQVDPIAESFNEKGVQFNGDLGLDFNTGGFDIGATAYNLGAYFKNQDQRESDLQIAQVLSSYRFTLANHKLSITPLAAYKMFYHSDDIFLVAAQFEYQDVFHTSLYWQSTGSVMGGLGFMVRDFGEINFFYASKNKYGYHDQYEVGLKINLK